MNERKCIEVAAAVIVNAQGDFLLAQRPPSKPYSGYWEFPGGKIEEGESVRAALVRELEEELGINVTHAYPWITRDYDYTHASVRLHFHRVIAWTGELHGREGQVFVWQTPDKITVEPLLPANAPILRALQLPYVYGISSASAFEPEGGHRAAMAAFLVRFKHALQHGLRLLQIREKNLPREDLRALTMAAVTLAHAHGARVLLNSGSMPALEDALTLARETSVDGVHLTAAQLMSIKERPAVAWCGASCHTPEELAQAIALGLDFAVLGPVLPTPSHPGAAGIGWDRFEACVRDLPIPVYAIGGLHTGELENAWQRGAHGVAMLRGIQ